MTQYVMTDSAANTDSASVDGIELVRGGEPVELGDEQAQRLKDAGVKLRIVTPAETDADATDTDDEEGR